MQLIDKDTPEKYSDLAIPTQNWNIFVTGA